MVRLSDDERATLEERAGLGKIAGYLRSVGLGREPKIPRLVPEANRANWLALAPVLANLNQLTRHANEGRVVSDELRPVLDEVRSQVMALRSDLVGRRDPEDL